LPPPGEDGLVATACSRNHLSYQKKCTSSAIAR
jgi:hypothetical protein